MEWRKLVAFLGAALAGGCQLLVTFEDVPGGAGTGATGGSGGGGSTGGAPTGGSAGGSGGATCAAECCADADCPLPVDPCQSVSCQVGQCALAPVADGEDASIQTPGDCKRLVCQGGKAAPVTDGADVLDDGNDCTKDSCQGDEPRSSLLGGVACALPGGGAGLCNSKGMCVECLSNAHCPDRAPECDQFGNDSAKCVPPSCSNGAQDPGETAVNCGGPACAPCDKNKGCLVGSDCISGLCGPNGECAEPTCTDGIRNDNEADVDCGGGCPDCLPGQRCNGGGDCTGGECTGNGGVCVANCDDKLANNTESDVDCGGGVCAPCPAGAACGGVSANCLSGKCAPDGSCEPGELGSPCQGAADCVSGSCADGVCCNTQCTGLCRSCKLAGSAGTCTDIPAGQDPQNECLAACNGSGACQ